MIVILIFPLIALQALLVCLLALFTPAVLAVLFCFFPSFVLSQRATFLLAKVQSEVIL
jgi:hypothetical protein